MIKALALLFTLITSPAFAGVSCTLPFQLQNNQLADASQVMANYNALVTCLGLAAAAGTNNDITSLNALTTPIRPALGGTSVYTASATSTGSANAQVVATTVPTPYALVQNNKIIFTAGFSNTTNMTLAVGGTPATSVFRRTTDGVQPLAGGEIIAGTITEVVFDGVQYQLMSNVSPFPVGTVLDTISAAADAGFLLMNGSCQPTATFTALWTKMGSPASGSCGAGNFALPDGRGSVVAMLDSGGSTNINIYCGANQIGTICGQQQRILSTAMLPLTTTGAGSPHAHSVFIRDPGHTHSPGGLFSTSVAGALGVTSGSFSTTTIQSNTTGIHANSVNGGLAATDDATATESAHTHTFGSASPNAVPTVQSTVLLNRQIKY
jgi:hypothetical protein